MKKEQSRSLSNIRLTRISYSRALQQDSQSKKEGRLPSLGSKKIKEAAHQFRSLLKTQVLPLPNVQKCDLIKKIRREQNKSVIIQSKETPQRKGNFGQLEKLSCEEFIDFKHKNFFTFLQEINFSNGVKTENYRAKYKFYIGPGNNSQAVTRVMRTRWWWIACESPSKSNFVWTSLKHIPTLQSLQKSTRNSLEITAKSSLTYSKSLGYDLITQSSSFFYLEQNALDSSSSKVHNRLQSNSQVSNKKRLFFNLKKHYSTVGKDLFEVVPLTYHIKNSEDCSEFTSSFEDCLWIIKPGENSNRGNGILISDKLEEIMSFVQNKSHTYIAQKYISNPMLVNNRKFDIRCYGLFTSINGVRQGYYFQDGYIRTSGHEFSLKSPEDIYVHLTNDAIQQHSSSYGKFEPGNKMSYAELESVIKNIDFDREIVPQMKDIIRDTFKATFEILDPVKKMHCFELFGYDFIIDCNKKVWLLEVNTNPCLDQGCFYLSTLIPSLLENTFKIVLDPIFPPPNQTNHLNSWLNWASIENKYELIFSESEYMNN